MNSDQSEFETLRKLMALKRHEQPPPEYLDELTGAIIHRIERGEGQRNMWDRLSATFASRPSLIYACGLTICGAIGVGALYMVKQEVTETEDTAAGMVLHGSIPSTAYAIQVNPTALNATPPPIHVANWLGNTNPSAETSPQISLFNTPHAVVPVAYETGN